MITAKQAKELYEQSGQEIQDYLAYKVEPEINAAAVAGQRLVFIVCGSIESYLNIQTTPFSEAVVSELKKLGYIARYGKDPNTSPQYVPAGLRNDDGSGPIHVNYGFIIGW